MNKEEYCEICEVNEVHLNDIDCMAYELSVGVK